MCVYVCVCVCVCVCACVCVCVFVQDQQNMPIVIVSDSSVHKERITSSTHLDTHCPLLVVLHSVISVEFDLITGSLST